MIRVRLFFVSGSTAVMIFRYDFFEHLRSGHGSGIIRVAQGHLAIKDLAFIHIQQLLLNTVKEVIRDDQQRLLQPAGPDYGAALRKLQLCISHSIKLCKIQNSLFYKRNQSGVLLPSGYIFQRKVAHYIFERRQGYSRIFNQFT
ncbi:hypothetical protein D3C72_1957140 [compost metagenome]